MRPRHKFLSTSLIYSFISFGIMGTGVGIFDAKAESSKELIFGVYTSDQPTQLFTEFRPVLDKVEASLAQHDKPLKIRLQIAKTYAEGLQLLTLGKIDLARFGPASYINALESNSKIKLLALEIEEGETISDGVFITQTQSSINSLKDLKKKKVKFAFGDPLSTIGRYLAQAELIRNGIHSRDLGMFEFLDRHDKVALAVLGGTHDVGVVKVKVFEKYKSRGLKSVGRFKNVTKPWVAREALEPEIAQAITDALLSIKKDDPSLKSLKIDGFQKTTPEVFNFVRIGMEKAKSF